MLSMQGGAGDDTLSGGPGADTISGGAGDDDIDIGPLGEADVATGGAGLDVIRSDYTVLCEDPCLVPQEALEGKHNDCIVSDCKYENGAASCYVLAEAICEGNAGRVASCTGPAGESGECSQTGQCMVNGEAVQGTVGAPSPSAASAGDVVTDPGTGTEVSGSKKGVKVTINNGGTTVTRDGVTVAEGPGSVSTEDVKIPPMPDIGKAISDKVSSKLENMF